MHERTRGDEDELEEEAEEGTDGRQGLEWEKNVRQVMLDIGRLLASLNHVLYQVYSACIVWMLSEVMMIERSNICMN